VITVTFIVELFSAVIGCVLVVFDIDTASAILTCFSLLRIFLLSLNNYLIAGPYKMTHLLFMRWFKMDLLLCSLLGMSASFDTIVSFLSFIPSFFPSFIDWFELFCFLSFLLSFFICLLFLSILILLLGATIAMAYLTLEGSSGSNIWRVAQV
jgi:hypothetical protein